MLRLQSLAYWKLANLESCSPGKAGKDLMSRILRGVTITFETLHYRMLIILYDFVHYSYSLDCQNNYFHYITGSGRRGISFLITLPKSGYLELIQKYTSGPKVVTIFVDVSFWQGFPHSLYGVLGDSPQTVFALHFYSIWSVKHGCSVF